MATVKERQVSVVQPDKKSATCINTDKPDLADEKRFALVSKDPFFKRKAEEMEDMLSNLKLDQKW